MFVHEKDTLLNIQPVEFLEKIGIVTSDIQQADYLTKTVLN